jgi:outer membrane protein assembly factor BamB
MKSSRTIIARVALCLAVGVAHAADPSPRDYPCWRGPFGNGSAPDCGKPFVAAMSDARLVWTSAEDIPLTWDVPKGRWRASFGSPVVAAGKVFLHYYTPAGYYAADPARRSEVNADVREADDVLLCLDAATGEMLWRTVYEKSAFNEQGGAGKSNGHGMLCVENGRAYVLAAGGKVFCVDIADGRKVWDKDTGGAYAKRLETTRAGAEAGLHKIAPALADGVFVCGDGATIGFDATTGKELWRAPGIGGTRGAGGYVRWVHKGREYVLAAERCLDPRTGKVVWSLPSGVHRAGFTPAVTEDHVVYGNYERGLTCYKIDEKGGTLAWDFAGVPKPPAGKPAANFNTHFSSPLIHRGRVYCWASVPGSKSVVDVVCLDLASGKVLGSVPAAGSETCTSIVGSDGVAITGHRGNLAMFAYDGKEFKRVGEPLLVKWESYTTPALADGRLYVRLFGRLACYDLVQP